MFVYSRTNALGPGKAVRKGAISGHVVVEYFDTPAQASEEPIEHEVPIDGGLKPYPLSPETRVFWRVPDEFPAWRTGRVVYATGEGHFAVRTDSEPMMLPEADVYVRYQRDLVDPLGFAAAGVFESPYNAERRTPFLRSVLEQRAAAQGLSGLLSTSVELHAHQVHAAQTVLSDHTQRYLLADEVGLGKTIETLMVLRQLLIDHRSLSAMLIVPEHLVAQWQEEVDSKLHPEHFPEARIRIVSHSEPEAWASADVVVVDEAHQLVTGMPSSREPQGTAFAILRRVAHESPRLLLLSATPALHNERSFLAMLHLLEPHSYALDGHAELRSRLETRQDLGRALLRLSANTPSFLLSGVINDLRPVVAGDPELNDSLDRILNVEGEERRRAIVRLRGQLRDRYQVHRRMVRARRTEGLVESFPVAGRRGITEVELEHGAWTRLEEYLEECRNQLAVAVEEQKMPPEEAARTLADLVGAGPDATALTQIARRHPPLLPAVTAEKIDTPGILQAVADALTFEITGRERVVVFAPTGQIADDLAAALTEFCGEGAVRTARQDQGGEALRDAVVALRDRECQWLIVDPVAEDGTNLQFADVLVHLGLPSSANRVEQRIGRLDRWNRDGHGWRGVLVAPSTGVSKRWADVLERGFRVHDRSIAALQRAVEEQSERVWTSLLDDTLDIRHLADSVADNLDEEVQAVREQDAIDAMGADEMDEGFADGLIQMDAVADEEFGRVVHELVPLDGLPGNLRFMREGNPATGVGRYVIGDPQRKQQMPLVPIHRLHAEFFRTVRHSWAAKRPTALDSRTGILRTGAPLVDSIERFLRHDDRGRSWGMWRWREEHHGKPQMWLRFDLHITHDISVVAASERQGQLDEASILRRLEVAFPPAVHTVWRDIQERSPSEEVRRVLEEPYRKPHRDRPGQGDFNLSRARVEAATGVLHTSRWVEVIRGVERQVRKEMLTGPQVAGMAELAETRLRRDHDARTFTLRARAKTGLWDEAAIVDELHLEQELLQRLCDAVQRPRMVLDSFGLVVLSAENPFEGTQEDDAA